MATTLEVSVVVATYNRCAGLEQLLHALARQSYPSAHFEVVVVDDGSTDGTTDLLASIVMPYSLRSLSQENRGPAAARNRGVENARGRLIIFQDDDVVPVSHLIEAHVAAHGTSTDLVVTGPMLPPPSLWKQPAWDRWDAEQLQKQYRAMMAGHFACSQRQFFTANASVHRDLFLASGGFDEQFRRAEDMELAWRMSRHGARFAFEPRAEIVHYAARPFVAWCRNAYQYGRYDVVMEREKAIPVFGLACKEFHRRRAVNRWLTRLCLGRPMLRDATLFGLTLLVHMCDRFGRHGAASVALSSIFNVRYWQGARDELGSTDLLLEAIADRGRSTFAQSSRAAEPETQSRLASALVSGNDAAFGGVGAIGGGRE